MSDSNSPQLAEESFLGEVPSLSDEQWDGMLEDAFIAPPGMADHLVDLFDDPAENDTADYADDAIDPDVIDNDAIFDHGLEAGTATDADPVDTDQRPSDGEPSPTPESTEDSAGNGSLLDSVFGTAEFSDDAAGIDTGEFGGDQALDIDQPNYDSADLGESHDTDNDFDTPGDDSDAFLV